MSTDLDALRDAIATVAGDGSFVTRYAVTAEVIDPDGEHAVHTFTDCDLMYQVLGLLEHGKEVAKAHFHGWDDDDE
jgi:hypothetical protein